jgi:hypothetical protein
VEEESGVKEGGKGRKREQGRRGGMKEREKDGAEDREKWRKWGKGKGLRGGGRQG